MNNKRKILIIVSVLFISSIVMFALLKSNSSNKLIIVDNNQELYYQLNNKIKINKEQEYDSMLIKDNYFADSVIKQVIEDLKKQGYSYDEIIKNLNSKGWIIKSTVDKNVQSIIEEKYSKRETFTTRAKSNYNQSAAVIMDYEGNIKGLVGSNNGDDKNRATSTLIRVGSTIKPISIYAPAIEVDLINFSSIIEDTPSVTYIDGKAVSWPQNYDNRYEISVTATEALQKSKNTIAVNIGKLIGEQNIIKFLKEDLKFQTLVEDINTDNDVQLAALALGYFNKGITLDKLVSAYSMFGNSGYYSESKLYTEVVDKEGNLIIKNNRESKKVIEEDTAWIMNRMLKNNVSGEYAIAKNAEIEGLEVLGKSGSVEDDGKVTSQLFVGMTPEYIGGVWIGNDNNNYPLEIGTYTSPNVILKNILSELETEKKVFDANKSVITEEYCNLTGLKKSDNCKKVNLGYYKTSTKLDICNKCK